MSVFKDILKQYWGYDSFRPLQEDIINSIYNKKDTLGLMPTGGGKSLTFQVPAMVMEGLCIVVTPLIALMKDQVDNLQNKRIRALAIYSGMTRQEIQNTLENSIHGDFKFLYVSPERLHTELFLKKLQYMQVCLLVIDEAHCISQWGYDFRPSYLNISKIREHIPNVPVLALTASATPTVVEDIQKQLNFSQENVFSLSFYRKNLIYRVENTENKIELLIKYLEKSNSSSIVYVRSRKKTKEISDFLSQQGFNCDFFHAGLSYKEKNRKQNAWKSGEIVTIVCTNAFGMGIDKPDVRLVLHMDLPNSLEEYYQEAGRAGRDGADSIAVILYDKTDSTKLQKRIINEYPEKDFILHVYDCLAYFYQIADGFGIGITRDFNLGQFCKIYKLPILPAHNALRILDLSGYIEYTDEIDNRSRLIFRIFRDDLYQYGFPKEYELLVNTLLRLYTGLFTDYATIDEQLIADKTQTSRNKVYEMLKYLKKRGVIDYIPHKKTPLISYKQPRLASQYIYIPRIVYEERQMRFKNRIEAMLKYVGNNTTCRSSVILHYFSESEVSVCGKCDICESLARKSLKCDEYSLISKDIISLLESNPVLGREVINSLSFKYSDKAIRYVIKDLIDKGTIALDLDKLYIREL